MYNSETSFELNLVLQILKVIARVSHEHVAGNLNIDAGRGGAAAAHPDQHPPRHWTGRGTIFSKVQN